MNTSALFLFKLTDVTIAGNAEQLRTDKSELLAPLSQK